MAFAFDAHFFALQRLMPDHYSGKDAFPLLQLKDREFCPTSDHQLLPFLGLSHPPLERFCENGSHSLNVNRCSIEHELSLVYK